MVTNKLLSNPIDFSLLLDYLQTIPRAGEASFEPLVWRRGTRRAGSGCAYRPRSGCSAASSVGPGRSGAHTLGGAICPNDACGGCQNNDRARERLRHPSEPVTWIVTKGTFPRSSPPSFATFGPRRSKTPGDDARAIRSRAKDGVSLSLLCSSAGRKWGITGFREPARPRKSKQGESGFIARRFSRIARQAAAPTLFWNE